MKTSASSSCCKYCEPLTTSTATTSSIGTIIYNTSHRKPQSPTISCTGRTIRMIKRLFLLCRLPVWVFNIRFVARVHPPVKCTRVWNLGCIVAGAAQLAASAAVNGGATRVAADRLRHFCVHRRPCSSLSQCRDSPAPSRRHVWVLGSGSVDMVGIYGC